MSERLSMLLDDLSALELPTMPASLVGGEFVEGGGAEISLVDAFSGETLLVYRDAGETVAIDACAAAVSAQRDWISACSTHQRGRVLTEIAATIEAKAEALARLEAISAGKPIRDCRIEVLKVAEMFAYYAGWADKIHGEVIPVPSGHLTYTLREPQGVVFQATPWNAPIFTAGWQIAPAIATGNGVVIKPSEHTPLTTLALVRIAERAGLPVGLVNVLAGLGHTTAQACIAHPGVAKVVFVGSPQTGRAIAEAAGRHLKPCSSGARRQVGEHRFRRRRSRASVSWRTGGDLRRRWSELRRRLTSVGS